MNPFGRFSHLKERFQKQASDATHRAVQHHSPVRPPASTLESTLVDGENTTMDRDVKFARTFWLTGLVAGLIALLVWNTFNLLLLILLAYILSVGLEGPIRFVERYVKSRALALFLVYLFLVLFFLSMLLIIPFVAQQFFQLIQSLVSIISSISQDITTNGFDAWVTSTRYIPGWLKDNVLLFAQDDGFVTSLRSFLDTITQTVNGYLSGGLATDSFAFIRRLFGSSVMTGWQISLVLVLSVFFSLEYKSVFVFLVKFAPADSRPMIYQKMLVIYDKMQLWLKGQVFLMAYIFVITIVGLRILRLVGFDIPQIWLLALIAGVTEFLPYIGPILGGIPAVLVAFTAGGRGAALAVLILFVIVQWTENNIVVPVVMNKVLGVRSLIIFITMLVAAWLFGFVGVVMAVPLSVIITTFWSSSDVDTKTKKHPIP